MFEKLSQLNRHVEIELLLKEERLDHERHASLVSKPAELVQQLYEAYALQGHEHLHAVADKIGKLCAVDVESIRQHLVSKWLLSEGRSEAKEAVAKPAAGLTLSSVLDDSADVDASHLATEGHDTTQDDASIRKTIFMLRHGDRNRAVTFLLKVLFADTAQKIKNVAKFRSIHVLFAIASAAEVAHVAGRSLADVHAHVTAITYLYRLEDFHVKLSVKEFVSNNKEALVSLHIFFRFQIFTIHCYRFGRCGAITGTVWRFYTISCHGI